MKTFGKNWIIRLLFAAALFLTCLASCSRVDLKWEDRQEEKMISIVAHAGLDVTRTILSEKEATTAFSFEKGDALGFFVEDILTNKKLTCTDPDDGVFECSISVSGEAALYQASVKYCSYYPYTSDAGNSVEALSGELPYRQTAPFDARADYMVANPITARYDIDDMPALDFVFASHLFSIVKLTITNSSEEYASDKIVSVGLKSNTGKTLAGKFTFDATDPSAVPVFSENPSSLYSTVFAEYTAGPVLGINQENSVYVIVKAGEYDAGDLSLVVNTTSHRFTLDTRKAVTLRATEVTSFPVVDLYTAPRINESGKRRLALFGSSMTSAAYKDEVVRQLGPGWEIYRSGVGGNTMQNTAARQGGLAYVTGTDEFTLPGNSSEYVSVPALYVEEPKLPLGTGFKYTKADNRCFDLDHADCMMNPITIDGIECEVVYDEDNGIRIRRLANGEDKVIAPRTPVIPYSARAWADVDVLVAQISYNSILTNETLFMILDRMKAHLTKPDAIMLINGFLTSPYDWPKFWSQDYSDAFNAYYGDLFMDLRVLGGGANAIPLMYEIGQISREEDISETDQMYIARGDWPLSWSVAPDNLHAGPYGRKVIAILLRRRMAELNLL